MPDEEGARRRRLTKENKSEFARNQESSGQGRRSRDPQGPRPHREQGRGPCHHGPERLGQVDARPCAVRQARLRGDRRLRDLRRRRPPGPAPRPARGARHFPRLPVSAGNSRRRHHDVPAHRAQRPAQDARRAGAVDAGIPEARARGVREAFDQPGHAAAAGQCRLFRRREEAQRDPADGAVGAGARGARRDRFRASTSMRSRWSPKASTGCARRTAR